MSGNIDGVIYRVLECFRDHRGWVIELWRSDKSEPSINPAMFYVSHTNPQVLRGPHEHRFQTDCFAFIGPGLFRIYLWDNRKGSSTYYHHIQFEFGEEKPGMIIIPPGVVHAYRNISSTPGLVMNCPDALYAGQSKQGPVDEIRWEEQESPFQV